MAAFLAFFTFCRRFFSPRSHRWQKGHIIPFLQPLAWWKAHGLQTSFLKASVLDWCCVAHSRMPYTEQKNGYNHLALGFMWECHYRRKFRSQTSDNMGRWKAEQGRGREKRKIRRKKIRRERVRRKKMQMREKVGKSRNTVFFQWFVAPEGRKVGSLKRRVRSQLARWEMKKCTPLWREAHFQVKIYKTPQRRPLLEGAMSKKCTPLWREAHFQVKMYKTHQVRTTFGSWDVEKVHRCGAKHMSKWNCTKHTILGPLLEVEMSKKCTPLWREAHFQVKMLKTLGVRTTFGSCDVEKVHAVVARSTFPTQNVQNTTCSRHFWRFGCWKSARRCGAKQVSKSKCTKH